MSLFHKYFDTQHNPYVHQRRVCRKCTTDTYDNWARTHRTKAWCATNLDDSIPILVLSLGILTPQSQNRKAKRGRVHEHLHPLSPTTALQQMNSEPHLHTLKQKCAQSTPPPKKRRAITHPHLPPHHHSSRSLLLLLLHHHHHHHHHPPDLAVDWRCYWC